MSSPFQRAFSTKSPLKQKNRTRFLKKLGYSDKEIHGDNTETLLKQTEPQTKKKKPSMMDLATGPIRPLFPAKRVWEKAKKVYQAIDTPEERAVIKSKVKEAWKNIKGPRSTKVGN